MLALVSGRSVAPGRNTVDVADASYTNTIGAPLLTSYWKDPDFKPNQRAFYYVRVLEIPTPRWTTFDAKFYCPRLRVPMVPRARGTSVSRA